MVHLMLCGARQQARAIKSDFGAVKRLGSHVNPCRAPDVSIDLGDAQTTFRPHLLAFGLADLRVDENERHALLDLLRVSLDEHLAGMFAGGNIDNSKHEGTGHLLGSESDTIGSVHGFDHVGGELTNLGRDLFDSCALFAQGRVSVFDDFQDHISSIAKKQSVAKPDEI